MIGTKIFEIRKKRGLSLTELAERAKISKSYLSNIERNLNKNPSIQVLSKIANVLEVDLKRLLETNQNRESETKIENEWIDFVNELKDSGMEKENIKEFKTLIEFIKWKNEEKGRYK
jgi:XRE family transcriptional regulator, master regulator for biofilm formation